MKRWLPFIFLLLTAFSVPAITCQIDPVISDARGNVLAEETNGVPDWILARPTGNGAVPGYRPVAFGNGVDLAHSSAWRGHEVDVTGFYYLYNRYYDPVAGQWLSFDPMPNDLDPNGQSFSGGDSINYFDSSGLLAKQQVHEDAHQLSVASAFLSDQAVNVVAGGGYLLDEGASLVTGDPGFADAALRWQSQMSPFARQGYYNPNTPTAKLATAATIVIAPESAPGRIGTLETAVTRNITPAITSESIQAEASVIQNGVANNSTRLLTAPPQQLMLAAPRQPLALLPQSVAPKLLTVGTYVPNAGGVIRSFAQNGDQVYYRVFSGSQQGRFLTAVPPSSSAFAREALALPLGNQASFIQEVLVPNGTILQRSRALPAFGAPGGAEQFELLQTIPNGNFGPGTPLP